MNHHPDQGHNPNPESACINTEEPRFKVDEQFKDQLSSFIEGTICLLGIGNRHWRDDGVGSCVAGALKACSGLDVIDADFIPENFLEKVASKNPDTILMIDATDFGGVPGQTRLIYPDKVAFSGLSTHAGSLGMLAQYLHARTKARIALIAIQPADTDAGEGLSPEVSATFNELLEVLPSICGERTPG